MSYHNIAKRLSNTVVSRVPGISFIHRQLSRLIEWNHQRTAGETWVEYRGARLYADTSDHVAKSIVMRGDYEAEVQAAIESHLSRGDMAIDVGAHIGHHTVTMRQCTGRSGLVWLFEPNPRNVNYIRRTLRKNQWDNIELFPVALSDGDSSEHLVVTDSGNTGTAKLKSINSIDSNTASRADGYVIETQKLSSMLESSEIDTVDLLKIDVEGGEVYIIADLADHLQDIKTIILEVHTDVLDDNEIKHIFEILMDSGWVTDLYGNIVTMDQLLTETLHIVWHRE